MMKRREFGLVVFGLLLAFIWAPAPAQAQQKEGKELSRGRDIYNAACATCHGIKGDGNGPSAKWLDPRPRNFITGQFKWRSTPFGSLPTDADLERTIRVGVSGTEMFPFGNVLSERSRMQVVKYIKTFSDKFSNPAMQPKPGSSLKIPETRPFELSEGSVEAGKQLYATRGCAACHGVGGAGDGVAAAAIKDSWGYPLEPWDFTKGYYKGGKRDQDLYRSITTGLNGTPMAPFGAGMTDKQRWELVDYLRSIGSAKGFFYSLFANDPSGLVYENE